MRLHPRGGTGSTSKWFISGGCAGRVYLRRLLLPIYSDPFQKESKRDVLDRIGGPREEEESCCHWREKGARDACTRGHVLTPTTSSFSFFCVDLKSVARSPVFTVSPFFLVYRPPIYRANSSDIHVIIPKNKKVKRILRSSSLSFQRVILRMFEGGKGFSYLSYLCLRGCREVRSVSLR